MGNNHKIREIIRANPQHIIEGINNKSIDNKKITKLNIIVNKEIIKMLPEMINLK